MSAQCRKFREAFKRLQDFYQKVNKDFNSVFDSQSLVKIRNDVQRLFESTNQLSELAFEAIGECIKTAFYGLRTLEIQRQGEKYILKGIPFTESLFLRDTYPAKILNYIEEIEGEEVSLILLDNEYLTDVTVPKVKRVICVKLKSAKGVKFREGIKILHLNSLEDLDGLELPKGLKSLILKNIKSVKEFIFPDTLEVLELSSLQTTDGLILDNLINLHTLVLNNLINADGLDLSSFIFLKHLILPDLDIPGLKVGSNVNLETLVLSKLRTPENLNLTPFTNLEKLHLHRLVTAKGLDLSPLQKLKVLGLRSLETVEGLNLKSNLTVDFASLPFDQLKILVERCKRQGLKNITFILPRGFLTEDEDALLKSLYNEISIIYLT